MVYNLQNAAQKSENSMKLPEYKNFLSRCYAKSG